MHKFTRYMAAAAFALVAISSCEEDDMNIGQSLTRDSDKLVAATTTFPVTTRTIIADSVLALSADCYLGRVRDPETQADVSSEFTTQFHILESTYIGEEDKIVGRDSEGRVTADSCAIILFLGSPYSAHDSLTAMKMRVSEMATPMEEGRRYYSNFSPERAGMLRRDGINISKVFSYANLSETDSARTDDDYQDCITIPMNSTYTATNGTRYKNYGTYILRQYFHHPELFRNSYTFIHNVCPGFLFKITDGLGFYAKVSNIGLRIYYTMKNDSTTYPLRLTYAGTREVLQTTHVVNDTEALQRMAAETSHTYLKTPAGLFTEVTLPVADIKQGHENDSLLAARVTFQRLNNESSDSRLLGIPKTLLMVQKDSLHSYFEQGSVPDNIMSYFSGYNNPVPTNANYAENTNTYTFNNLSSLITILWQIRQKGVKEDPQWEEHHPDWNRVVLVPITYTTLSSSSSALASIAHDMSLTSIRLAGGPNNTHDPITISVVYANYK